MRPRTEAAIAIGGFALAAALVAIAGSGRRGVLDQPFDPRSTYHPGPNGARALADVLPRLGVAVYRYRRPSRELPDRVPGPLDSLRPVMLAVLDPAVPLSGSDALQLLGFAATRGDVLATGRSAQRLARCLGYEVLPRADSITVAGIGPRPAYVSAVLGRTGQSVVADTMDAGAGVIARCRVPAVAARDTLLVTTGNRLVAIRLRLRSGHAVTLVSDGTLFGNRSLKDTDAAEAVVPMLTTRARAVYFDEYHQGYASNGSLLRETLAWSRRSPWGWGAWQLAVVGLLALLAAAVRFGPVVPGIVRQRRSPMEHVRALATALAAARGHDVAARLMVQGLRRRLSRDNRPQAEPVESWLAQLAARVRSARARAAVNDLQSLIHPPQPADAVLRAAYAVEDVWQELRP